MHRPAGHLDRSEVQSQGMDDAGLEAPLFDKTTRSHGILGVGSHGKASTVVIVTVESTSESRFWMD